MKTDVHLLINSTFSIKTAKHNYSQMTISSFSGISCKSLNSKVLTKFLFNCTILFIPNFLNKKVFKPIKNTLAGKKKFALLNRSYFKGRAFIKIIYKIRSRSYFRENTVGVVHYCVNKKVSVWKRLVCLLQIFVFQNVSTFCAFDFLCCLLTRLHTIFLRFSLNIFLGLPIPGYPGTYF